MYHYLLSGIVIESEVTCFELSSTLELVVDLTFRLLKDLALELLVPTTYVLVVGITNCTTL